MVDPFVWLWLLSFSMLTGSFLAGNVPLAFHFSEHRLRDVSSFGAGLLVGTALSVIVPEGVETLYGAYEGGKEESRIAEARSEEEEEEVEVDLDVLGQQLTRERKSERSRAGTRREERRVSASTLSSDEEEQEEEEERAMDPSDPSEPIFKLSKAKRSVDDDGSYHNPVASTNHTTTSHHESPHVHDSPHRLVGLALTTGFVFMLFVEQFSHHDHHDQPSSSSHRRSHHPEFTAIPMYESGSLVVSGTTTSSSLGAGGGGVGGGGGGGGRKGSATLGLVVHAAADGIALGAASSSKQSSLEMIVFFAIMLHKAPSAFGLCTFLLHEGFTRRQIRQHLALFSVSAPLSALLTFAVLHNSGFDPLETRKWTGFLLLFSAGTFLHVAIHIMNQVDVTGTTTTITTNPGGGGVGGGGGGGGGWWASWWNRWRGFAVLVGGVAFPLVVSVEHGH